MDVQVANAPIFRLPQLAYPKGIAADFSGRIVQVGAARTDFKVGDEVFGLSFKPVSRPLSRAAAFLAHTIADLLLVFLQLGKPETGCLSEILVTDTTTLLHKPSTLSHVQAAAIPLVALTALTTLSPPYTLLPPSPNPPTIVILGGSSSVGIWAVQYAVRKLGARVIATCSSRNAEFLKSLGAATTIDYTVESIPERLSALRPAEGYVGIIDCVGGDELFDLLPSLLVPRSLGFTAGGSYISIVGDKTARSTLGGPVIYAWHPRMVLRHFWGWWGSSPRYACVGLRHDKELLREVVELVEEGVEVWVDSEWVFEEAAEAFERLNEGRARGKVVVVVRP